MVLNWKGLSVITRKNTPANSSGRIKSATSFPFPLTLPLPFLSNIYLVIWVKICLLFDFSENPIVPNIWRTSEQQMYRLLWSWQNKNPKSEAPLEKQRLLFWSFSFHKFAPWIHLKWVRQFSWSSTSYYRGPSVIRMLTPGSLLPEKDFQIPASGQSECLKTKHSLNNKHTSQLDGLSVSIMVWSGFMSTTT